MKALTSEQIYQINTSILDCQARISNGAGIEEAFDWLSEELEIIYAGHPVHDVDRE